jgi:hypothetical protein
MPWPTLQTASRLADLANFFLIGSLVVGLIATATIVWMGNVKEEYWDAARIESAERTAELYVGAETARAAIAEANARALEAQAALAKFKAPRAIDPADREHIIAGLRGFAGQEFTGQVASAIPDGWDLWRQISLVLELAGWQRMPPRGLAVSQFGPEAGIPIAPQPGVAILFDSTHWTTLHPRAVALATELTRLGIAAFPAPTSGEDSELITIVIGPKPSQ